MPWFTVPEEPWVQAGAEVDAHGRAGSGVRRWRPGRGSWCLSATGGRPHGVDAITYLWVSGPVLGDAPPASGIAGGTATGKVWSGRPPGTAAWTCPRLRADQCGRLPGRDRQRALA